MDAKTLIENLIDAIEEIADNPLDAPGLLAAITEAKESAGLAKLILPSLDAPPAAAPSAFRVVRIEDAADYTYYGPFPDDVAAQTFIDNLPSGEDGTIVDVDPPANQGGSTGPTGPAPAAQASAPQQSYDEVLDDLKDANRRPGSVIANKPAGSLYKN
jgi:hypothetical protein